MTWARSLFLGSFVAVTCGRTTTVDTAPAQVAPPPPAPVDAGAFVDANAAVEIEDAAVPWSPPPRDAVDGPREIPLEPGRTVWYARPKSGSEPHRLVGHLHGVCGPPSYACGKWIGAGVDVGVMVCPTGNARCGDPNVGPASWEAPSWPELVRIMDRDLERAVARVAERHRGAFHRKGAVLTGYSRGAYAATAIARAHPNRWPFLVLVEAHAPLAASWLRKSGVLAVAMVAGERGEEIEKMRKTADALTADGYPAKLFVMRNTGHLYSDDMELVMHEALAFVLSHEHEAP